MSFLTINGRAISIANCRKSFEEIGDREPAFDGSARTSIRNRKRVWDVETALLTNMQADELEGIILGLGQLWHFDASIYSTKGLGPTGTPQYTLHSKTAADTRAVNLAALITGSLEVDEASTNLLAADDRDVEVGIGGFTAVDGATLSQDATYYWQGTKSMKVITSAAANTVRGGVYVQKTGESATTRYTASAYVLCTTSVTLRIRFRDNTNGTETIVTQAVTANIWYRIFATHLTGAAGAVTLQLFIEENTADSNITFYVDGLQIEQKAYLTSWVDGARSTDDMFYLSPEIVSGGNDMSVSFWTQGPPYDPSVASTPVIMVQADTDASAVTLFSIRGWNDTSNVVNVQVTTYNAAGSGSETEATIAWTTVWHHIVGVLRYNKDTNEYNRYVYVNGALVQAETTGSLPILAAITQITVGSPFGYHQFSGKIDELMILPFAATAETIAAWYARGNAGTAMPSLPRFVVSGDILSAGTSAAEVTCIGEIQDSNVMPWQDGTAFRNNGRKVRFKMREV